MDIERDLKIVSCLPDSLKRLAAELYYEAFKRKIRLILKPKEKAILFLERVLNTDTGVYAIYKGRVVGITGFDYLNHRFMDITYQAISEVFGISSALFKWVTISLINWYKLRERELWINPIAVSRSMQRKKIGTKMIESTFKFAKENGFNSVKLHVIDTNIGARRLYERMGFVAIKVRKYYFMTRIAGFSSVIVMQKKI